MEKEDEGKKRRGMMRDGEGERKDPLAFFFCCCTVGYAVTSPKAYL